MALLGAYSQPSLSNIEQIDLPAQCSIWVGDGRIRGESRGSKYPTTVCVEQAAIRVLRRRCSPLAEPSERDASDGRKYDRSASEGKMLLIADDFERLTRQAEQGQPLQSPEK